MTLRDRLGAELFRKVAGPDGQQARERVHGTPGPRWFDPDSPIARVHGDASMFVGGIRAIMLQSLHPAAMQGVADHSGYQGDMWGRLAQVSTYIAMTTFGTERDALQIIRAVQRAHESVTGTMPDGTSYAANDPHLLGWVHVAEIDSFLAAHDRYGHRRLVGPERDEYVAQTAVAAAHLGVVDPPRTEDELRRVLAAYGPELRGTPAAHEAIRFLLLHPDLPLPARPGYLSLAAAAIGLLPADARRELRLPPVPPLTNRVLGAARHPHDPLGDVVRARAGAGRSSGDRPGMSLLDRWPLPDHARPARRAARRLGPRRATTTCCTSTEVLDRLDQLAAAGAVFDADDRRARGVVPRRRLRRRAPTTRSGRRSGPSARCRRRTPTRWRGWCG